MTNTIVSIPDEIRNEFRIDPDGKAFVSIRGAARIADINDKTLGDSLKTAAGITDIENPQTPSGKDVEAAGISVSKLAQSLIDAGFSPGDFYPLNPGQMLTESSFELGDFIGTVNVTKGRLNIWDDNNQRLRRLLGCATGFDIKL